MQIRLFTHQSSLTYGQTFFKKWTVLIQYSNTRKETYILLYMWSSAGLEQ